MLRAPLSPLRTVAFERRREIAGHAVRAGYLLAQQAGLLLGFVEQLVPGVDLTRQTADPLFGGRAALLELGDLLLLGGDPLFEGRDDLFLRLDAAVVLGAAAKTKSRKTRVSVRKGLMACYSAVLELLAGCFSRSSICRAS